jgi:hypothetical protein
MKRTKFDDEENQDLFVERKIITGLIISNEYAAAVARVFTPECLGGASVRVLAGWCLDHFRKYGRVPGRDIEGIYTEKLKGGLPEDQAESVEHILRGLSEEYDGDFNVRYWLDQTHRHFQLKQAEALHERQGQALRANDTEAFYRLHAEFKPTLISDLGEDGNINAAELFDMDIKGPTWLVKDLIPIGLTILGGRSKVGKSYFMLNVAMALSQGKPVFDSWRGQRGSVLYLSLEDGKKRFQTRMHEIDPDPDRQLLGKNLIPRFEWDKLNRGGLQAITQWIEQAENPKLIVIDTLAKVWNKKSTTGGGGLYAEEYAIYGPLADLAHKQEISIVLLTHTIKGRAADVFDEILGGMGTQGPADNLIVLANDAEGRKRFNIRGKDIEEKHLAFETPGGPAHWECLGDTAEVQKTAQRQEIMDVLGEHEDPMTLQEIQAALKARGSKIATPHIILKKMVSLGVLEQLKNYGPYYVAGYKQEKVDAGIGRKLRRIH